jgi:hypothetical protein
MNAVCGVSSVGICIRPGWLHFVLVEFWLGRGLALTVSPRVCHTNNHRPLSTRTTQGAQQHKTVREPSGHTGHCHWAREASHSVRRGATVPRPWGLDLTRDFSVASCETTHIVDVPAGEKKKSAGLS